MEKSPEAVFTFDTAIGQGMSNANVLHVEETGEQTAEMVLCDNCVESLQSQTKKAA